MIDLDRLATTNPEAAREIRHLREQRDRLRVRGRELLEEAPRYPEDDGLGMFGGVSLGVSLDAVTDVLSQHGLAVAEERLTEDAATGADPWSAIAESVEAEHDWGPLSDEPSPSPRELN
jgi:hypothetical protein